MSDDADQPQPPEETTEPVPTAENDREAMPIDDEEPPRLPFPVVGIGASAGGLEAMSEFLAGVRPDSGMAYVFIQHLPPTGESLLAEILARRTELVVLQVEDQMQVEPDHLYVIRPGHTLIIKHGRFHLGKRLATPMHNRPVDDFFKSLAQEQRERAIAVILSGMGSNGTAGAQAIKAVGGLCIAQDPETTQYPSMPRHLIDANYADYILHPRDIASVIAVYAGHPYAKGQREAPPSLGKRDEQHLREIFAILRTRTHQDFSGYKKPTVLRRIQRRTGLNRITDLAEYAKLLREMPVEVNALADDLLIHVTGFFRDPQAWETLRERVIVPLVASRSNDESIRCWVAACSSGEEAYTLAMLIVEEAERTNKLLDVKVFATDMAERSLQNARAGIYPGGIEAEIIPERLERFFHKEDAVYRVRQELRERVLFAPQNVLQDPPFSKLDIATCRNLLIYLEPEMQLRILSLLHFGLRDGGTLFLGTSETVSDGDLFEPIDKSARIYRRVGATRHGGMEFTIPRRAVLGGPKGAGQSGPIALGRTSYPGMARPSIAQMVTRALIEHHAPAAVTIDRDYRIVYFHGNTEPFITLPRGEPTRHLLEVARESVRGAIRNVVQRVTSSGRTATVLDGSIEIAPGKRTRLAVIASPLDAKHAPGHILVSFQERGEIPTTANDDPAVESNGSADNAELQRIREELHSTIEELQTRNEELKASNEEVVSTNEELQSTNEELETSREELQSLNEELSTVNAQLRAKMEEHQAASNDLASLLTSTDIAVLFLDTQLRIRRYTPAVRELMDVIHSDVGRPFSDLARKFEDPDLDADARDVLDRLATVQREITAANGRLYSRRMLPYRTLDNRIEGVVVTFVDVTEKRQAEIVAATSREFAEKIVETIHEPLLVLHPDLTVHSVNGAFYTTFQVHAAQTVGRKIYDLGNGQWDIPALRKALEEVLPKTKTFDDFEVRHTFNDIGQRVMLLNGRRLDHVQLILLGIRDITAQRQLEETLQRAADEVRQSDSQVRLVVEGMRDFAVFMMNPAGQITTWNIGAEGTLGYAAEEAIGLHGSVIFTPEDLARDAERRERQTAEREGRAEDQRWHVRKNGSRFWANGVLNAIRRTDGALVGFVKVLRDETLRKETEDALYQAKEAAEAASTAKDEFLAILSHELRTPLAAILLWARMLRSKNAETEQVEEAVNAITSSAEAQRQLIDDLLDTSRITSGKLRIHLREIEVLPFVRDSVDAIKPTADVKGIEVYAQAGPDIGTVHADPDRLRQVIWNLLTNAVKFTPPGGRVDVAIQRTDGYVEIRIRDTGEGIGPDFLPHMFESFRQADSSTTRRHGGLGLGLAIVKRLVELHGGSIEASSKGVGQGSTFTVRLPHRAPRSGSSKRRALPKRARNEIETTLPGVKILLVEDDVETRRALTALLRQAGATVVDTASVAAALEAYDRQRPDLILSDIGMPHADGNEFIRRLREHEQDSNQPPVPAVALTALATDEDRGRSIEAGFQSYLSKPVDPEMLLATLADLLPASPDK